MRIGLLVLLCILIFNFTVGKKYKNDKKLKKDQKHKKNKKPKKIRGRRIKKIPAKPEDQSSSQEQELPQQQGGAADESNAEPSPKHSPNKGTKEPVKNNSADEDKWRQIMKLKASRNLEPVTNENKGCKVCVAHTDGKKIAPHLQQY
eukprot:TRINITY_DN15213_c0_g1_i19.p1 TRINITY_DN15213_c0_g1~~TRINITY_DN15213_c0_g1_i19.p1  ORF type:complete len:147 (+),score=22.18 TRINITY_DN15213_c0_g1_i19:184-624(+)